MLGDWLGDTLGEATEMLLLGETLILGDLAEMLPLNKLGLGDIDGDLLILVDGE